MASQLGGSERSGVLPEPSRIGDLGAWPLGPSLDGVSRPWWDDHREALPRRLLAAGCVAYFVLFVYLTRHFSFFQDEYAFIIDRFQWSANAFLMPHNQAMSLVPVAIYKLLFVTVGMQTTWPYRIPVFLLHIACVAGIYVLTARRAGAWIALVPAGLLLVLGAAAEDELWAFQVGFLASLAAAVWALICLDRGDQRGDLLAMVLVGVSLASSNVGLPVAFAVAVELALSRPRRLWVVGLPLVLYGLWYVHYGQSDIVWSNARAVPRYDVQIGAYGFAGLLGFSSSIFGAGGPVVTLGALLLAVAGLLVLRRRVLEGPLPTRTVTGIAGAIAFWTATALARAQFHQPDASRYIYPSVVFLVIAAIGLLRWRRISPRVALLVTAAGAVVAVLGLAPLRQYAIDRTSVDARVRVAFGAAQLAGSAGDPGSYPDHHHLAFVTLGAYLAAVRELGSPAFSVAQIEREPPAYRQLADATLTGVEQIAVEPYGTLSVGASCSPSPSTSRIEVAAPPGTMVFVRAARGAVVQVWLRRLSSSFSATPLATIPPGGGDQLYLPRDLSTIRWYVGVRGRGRVCSSA